MQQQERQAKEPSARGTVELIAAVMIALTALLTAWAAFQHAKWNGVQAEASREAAALGLRAAQSSTVANAQRTVDVGTYLSWLEAVKSELDAGTIGVGDSGYAAQPGTLSAFIAERFRLEFKTAFDAWLANRPFVNSDAPSTPFVMKEYQLEAEADVSASQQRAEALNNQATQANDRGEGYVLLTVLFAMALVFASLGSRLAHPIARSTLLGTGVLVLLTAVGVLATFPVEL